MYKITMPKYRMDLGFDSYEAVDLEFEADAKSALKFIVEISEHLPTVLLKVIKSLEVLDPKDEVAVLISCCRGEIVTKVHRNDVKMGWEKVIIHITSYNKDRFLDMVSQPDIEEILNALLLERELNVLTCSVIK
jgi:hypothetical protein